MDFDCLPLSLLYKERSTNDAKIALARDSPFAVGALPSQLLNDLATAILSATNNLISLVKEHCGRATVRAEEDVRRSRAYINRAGSLEDALLIPAHVGA